ncbi:MAG: hypothetical protein AAF637_01430 [Pseudomonadota bacterium]
MLLTALAVLLLASISTTMATSASALSLIDDLRRDLAAVRAQLESVDPSSDRAERQSVAFNTDLGDGGSAFRHRSMATILRSAERHLANLLSGYRTVGDERRTEIAERAEIGLRLLVQRVRDLGDREGVSEIQWYRKRTEAEALLDQLHDALVVLLPRPNKETGHLG